MSNNFIEDNASSIEISGTFASEQAAEGNPFAQQLAAHGVPTTMWPMLASHGVGTLVEKLGIIFSEISVDRVVATMPVEGNQQVAGILHGGASVALAETLGSFAAAVHGQGARKPVGVDISATHHRAGVTGLVTGVCTPIHLGRTLTTHEIVISDEAGRRLCTSRITNMLLDG
ncbi:hotdog fold thioesterase [Paeniglutamicibacter sp. Y32M11]|uniref:hotdog fold thioesterase n=1 Tax=Paeniglutamicibacter sp. Y32M11 TaxID=2853258 RepID=UPI002103E4E6|nr:hotdog fold thioesterase [Paeniglutamicibacter sp. Y32M11]